MRYLMLFTLGFAGACTACAYLFWTFPAGAVAALAVAFALWLPGRTHRHCKAASRILLGVGMGFLWFSLFGESYLKPVGQLEEKTHSAAVILTDYSREENHGSSAAGILRWEGKPYGVRIYLKENLNLKPGDSVRGEFSFRVTAAKSGKFGHYYAGKGIFLTGYQKGELVTRSVTKSPWWTAPARMRLQIQNRIDDLFPADTAAFARALVLGDSDVLDYGTASDLSVSGIRHMVAVSGLHVSILCALLALLIGRRRWLTCILGLPLLAMFCAVTGFTPSVTRASIMMGLMMIAGAIDREYDPLTELSAAVLVMTVLNPMVVTSVSFQLSVASVLGILLFYGKVRAWLMARFRTYKGIRGKAVRWFCTSAAISLSTLVFVTPISAYYFGSISLIAPITNLLTVWAVVYIFWGILGVLVLGLFFRAGAVILAYVVSWLIRYVLGIAGILARIPLAAVYTQSLPIVIWLVSVYILGILFLSGRHKRPQWLLSLGTLGLAVALGISWLLPLRDHARVTVLDVGQGQCILLQSGGRSFLVDCGGDRDEKAADLAAQTLLSQGIHRLDGLILTHFDRDHVGGAPGLLHRVDAQRIYLPAGEELPADHRITVVEHSAKLTFGDASITIYGGGPAAVSNENSLCVLFDTGDYDILITGDRSAYGERLLMRTYPLPKVSCLVAGHHGAKDSTCQELLTAVQPDTVIISAGTDNPYGHPAGETLFRLRQFGCRVLRTDRDGTILIRR